MAPGGLHPSHPLDTAGATGWGPEALQREPHPRLTVRLGGGWLSGAAAPTTLGAPREGSGPSFLQQWGGLAPVR